MTAPTSASGRPPTRSLTPVWARCQVLRSTLAEIEAWAAGLSVPAYAIDDQTAIKVTDGTVEVVSEGHWKRFTANESR